MANDYGIWLNYLLSIVSAIETFVQANKAILSIIVAILSIIVSILILREKHKKNRIARINTERERLTNKYSRVEKERASIEHPYDGLNGTEMYSEHSKTLAEIKALIDELPSTWSPSEGSENTRKWWNSWRK